MLTCAVTKALRKYVESNKQIDLQEELKEELLNYGWLYPDVNYGRSFMAWLFADEQQPYGSAGAGSAMRVSAAGWLASSLAEAEEFAKMTAEITHSHAEGIKGAQAVAAAIFLAVIIFLGWAFIFLRVIQQKKSCIARCGVAKSSRLNFPQLQNRHIFDLFFLRIPHAVQQVVAARWQFFRDV